MATTNCVLSKDKGVNLVMPLEIDEPFEDIIVYEGATAVFECKVIGHPQTTSIWYKNGEEIHPSERIKIINDRKWRRLEIDEVVPEDHGLYSIVLKNMSSMTYSYAKLLIGKNTCKAIYTYPCPRWALSVPKQLNNVTVKLGERIELEVKFETECLLDYIWFKNDRIVTENERIMTLNNRYSSVLSIHCGKLSDSGIYTVVSRTKYGITSSTAEVHVFDDNIKVLDNVNAYIEEALPDDMEANIDEEIRLVCKVRNNINTIIKWLKNGVDIAEDKRMIPEIYDGDYFGLRIFNVQKTDSSEYSVVLENKITGHTDISSCFLTVYPSPMKNPPIVLLKKPLVSTVACYGSTITFDCGFEIKDPRYYYVVWHIGHFRIERSNTRFNVVRKDKDFLLHINKVEPGMAGEVMCELRRALPNRKSILINKTTANLAIVPASVLKHESIASINRKEPKIQRVSSKADIENGASQMFSNENSMSIIYLADLTPEGVINQSAIGHKEKQIIMNGNGNCETCFINQVALEINYCRLEEKNFHYLDVIKRADFMSSQVHVYEIEESSQEEFEQSKTIVLEWYDPPNTHMWYVIDLHQPDGGYTEVGVSSSPKFQIRDPPVDKMMEFRIRTLKPVDETSEYSICITPLPSGEAFVTKSSYVKEMEEFDSLFTRTSALIGCGAFGSVALVMDKQGDYYAAKTLKTRTQKKRDTAQREYEIMKELKHPKLVQLIDAFVAKDTFILVMDYLWGGELFDRIVEEEHIKEVDVVPYVRQICEALDYLHSHKIAHLDLKPENIICLSPNSRQVKIIDFGLARVLEEGHITRAIYGTRDYVAPEVLNFERLTLACDMWSLGVVTYMLLSGVIPFAGDSWPERSANITMANYNYDETAFMEISDLAKDFVDHLLILIAEERMSAAAALKHPWILEGPPKGAKAGHMKKTRENLKSYLANYRARWQRAGNVMIAAHRLRTQASNRNSAERASPVT
ncbi:uncharacterized protein LOC113519810 isoform X2 [Galleria mellonella]|nr:uncharacterized protein LOC113519810 isoform X2 [Galleria mellonella]